MSKQEIKRCELTQPYIILHQSLTAVLQYIRQAFRISPDNLHATYDDMTHFNQSEAWI